MKYTNNENLPQPIVDAILTGRERYSKGGADYSVTELLDPPQLVALKRKHYDEIEQDVSDLIWALLGSSVHKILEDAGVSESGARQELQLFTEVDGVKISGTMDYWTRSGYIIDWKLVSVWEVMHGLKPQKIQQLNLYAYLARENSLAMKGGLEVNGLGIVTLARDWSKGKARRDPDNYPQKQVQQHRVDMWLPDVAESFLRERVQLHTAEPRDCTLEEQWSDGKTYAVMKKGRKRAVKLFKVIDHGAVAGAEAKNWLAAQSGGYFDDANDLYIEERTEEKTRCLDYCPVRDFCPQFKREQP